jgi:formylglycine-generating enzyme required for sulfatase activity
MDGIVKGAHGVPKKLATLGVESGPSLMYVPGGLCHLGGVPEIDGSPRTPYSAYLEPYWIAKTPVTQHDYEIFVQSTGHRCPEMHLPDTAAYDWANGKPPAGLEDHPVVLVSWFDAAAYCEWLTETRRCEYRLPTEMEWERAARGVHYPIAAYPWGDDWNSTMCNNLERIAGRPICSEDDWSDWMANEYKAIRGRANTWPVGNDQPNALGLHDVVGNVWQWCENWYTTETVSRSDVEARSIYKVCRGGSWISLPDKLRCGHRCYRSPGSRSFHVGFRVACSDPEPNFH